MWMSLAKLQPGLQLQAIRWLFSRQMRDVCSSSLNKKSRQLSSTFEFYWVMTDHVLFGWGYTSCSQVFSCKQFGDFFLDRWEMFVLHPSTKNPDSCQALLNFIEWWLVMFCLDELFQVTTRSSAASNSVNFFSIDERCSFFIPQQKNPTAVKHFWILLIDDWSCFVWMRFFKLQPGLQLQAIRWVFSR